MAKQYGSAQSYEAKLSQVMERLGVHQKSRELEDVFCGSPFLITKLIISP